MTSQPLSPPPTRQGKGIAKREDGRARTMKTGRNRHDIVESASDTKRTLGSAHEVECLPGPGLGNTSNCLE